MVQLFTGGSAIDDRGSVKFVNDFNFDNVKRFYLVENHDINFIRAWHGHVKEGKYVYIVSGTALVAINPLNAKKEDYPQKFMLSEHSPKILWIPPGYYNGFKNLTNNTKIMFFSTSTLEESKGDDIRLDYDHWDCWKSNYR